MVIINKRKKMPRFEIQLVKKSMLKDIVTVDSYEDAIRMFESDGIEIT